MQACGQQKLSGSSFAGGYISGVPARFHSGRLAVIIPKSCVGEVLMHTGLHDRGQMEFSGQSVILIPVKHYPGIFPFRGIYVFLRAESVGRE
jgi:hypothetical protein